MAMTYEEALEALANDAAQAHVRWQESLRIQRERGDTPMGGELFTYAFVAKRALIVAISGKYEEGTDPGRVAIERAEGMMRESRHWRDY